MVTWITLHSVPRKWSYRTLDHLGTCRIDGRPLTISAKLELRDTNSIPDVLHLERVLGEIVREAGTVEEYAEALHCEFPGRLTLWGRTDTHGTIKVVLRQPEAHSYVGLPFEWHSYRCERTLCGYAWDGKPQQGDRPICPQCRDGYAV